MTDQITAEHEAMRDSLKVIYRIVSQNRQNPDAGQLDDLLQEVQGEIEYSLLFMFDLDGEMK